MKRILFTIGLIVCFSAGATYLQDPTAIEHGGTAATTAAAARTNLGVLPLSGGSLSGALTSGSTISATGSISSLAGITAQQLTATNLTPLRALVVGNNNNLQVSSVTDVQLTTLNSVTANVQTQLNDKATLSQVNARVSRTGDSMSGPLQMADGSASAPSLSFSGAADTGVYRTGLGNVGVSVSNATQFIVGVTAVTSSQPLIGAKGLAVTRTNIASAATLASADCSSGFINLTGTTATTLAGIAVPTNGGATVGMLCYVVNLTGQNLTVAHQSGSAGTAAERIITNTGADVVSTGNSTATFIYSQFEPRWILLNAEL